MPSVHTQEEPIYNININIKYKMEIISKLLETISAILIEISHLISLYLSLYNLFYINDYPDYCWVPMDRHVPVF